MAKVSWPKLKERLCWQPSFLPGISWAQTLHYSEENPSSSSYGELPVLCSTSRGKYWWGILYVLLWMLFHNRPRADIKPVIVVRKIRGKVVKFGSSGIKLVPLEAVDLSNSRIFGLIKLDFPFLSGSDYITSCCIGLLLFGWVHIGLVANSFYFFNSEIFQGNGVKLKVKWLALEYVAIGGLCFSVIKHKCSLGQNVP